VSAKNLGDCLSQVHGWTRTCGYLQAPPDNIQAGDVLVYHADSCDSYEAHAVIIVEGGSSPTIACHSSMRWAAPYDYTADSKPYFEWLHNNE